MEFLKAVARDARSLNPLRVAGTALPPQMLLMAKLIAVAYLLRGGIGGLSVPFLPFLPWLDRVPRAVMSHGLQAAFLVGVVMLLANRRVRAASFVLGVVILLAILASRPYYQNNRMFAGAVLVLTGLYRAGFASQLVRYQLVLLYVGAAANKLLDPAWRTGQFLSAWSQVSNSGLLSHASFPAPTRGAFVAMSWLVILTEFVIAATFARRRWFSFGIWLATAYHTGLLFVAGRTFGVFWFALLASFLAVAAWPPAAGEVFVGEAGGVREALGLLLRRLDFDRTFTWVSGPGSGVRLEGDRGAAGGVSALLRVALSLPAAYLLPLLLAARLPEPMVRIPALIVVLVLGWSAYRVLRGHAIELQRRYRHRPLTAPSRA